MSVTETRSRRSPVAIDVALLVGLVLVGPFLLILLGLPVVLLVRLLVGLAERLL